MARDPPTSILTLLSAISFAQLSDGLKLLTECGQINCQKYWYCNSDDICENCNKICNISSHNYEKDNCETHCQDFIHDYITAYVNASSFAQLQGTVERMQSLVIVSLSLAVVSIIIISAILFFAWMRYRRVLKFSDLRLKKKLASVNVINKMSHQQSTQNSGQNTNTANVNDGVLSLKMPSAASMMTINEQSVPASNATTTTPITPISNRYPSEDATLEYAYDNPALTPSPGTHLRRTETTF